MYCVLGAQAQTRWPIVLQGAKSLQTQDIFHRLVKDTITQDDPVKAVSDMRLAIKDTNVVLNIAITPGIILTPSDMIILKEHVAGYNNVLTLATKDMKFGVNKDINYVEPSEDVAMTTQEIPNLKPTVPVSVVKDISTTVFPKTNKETVVYLLGNAVTLGFLVAWYVIEMKKFHNLVWL